MPATLLRRNRNFRLVLSASAVSNLGDGVSALAFPWLASLLSRDAMPIALVAIGALAGGALVTLAEPDLGRDPALRLPMFVAAILAGLLALYALARLRTG